MKVGSSETIACLSIVGCIMSELEVLRFDGYGMFMLVFCYCYQ